MGWRFFAVVLGLVAVVVFGTAWASGVGVFDAGESEIRFENESVSAGFDYSHTLQSQSHGNGRQGVYANDFDNDGWTDLLVIGGNEGDRSPVMFRNVDGEFERADVLPDGATPLRATFKSAHFIDYNQDGWVDLFLLPKQGKGVMLKNAGGEFEVREVGVEEYFELPLGATTLDYNKDGCPDLFVIQSGNWRDKFPEGYQADNRSISNDNGEPNVLFEGDCSGFEEVEGTGISGDHWSLATTAADFNRDGYPDIHVANDFYNDVVYINQQDGTFERRTLSRETDRNGMSSELADVDGDGRPDLFVTNIHLSPEEAETDAFRRYIEYSLGKRGEGNTLLMNTGNGTFTDRGTAYGVEEGGWGWAAVIADFDNDGTEDVFHATAELTGVKQSMYVNYSSPMVWESRSDGFEQLDATDVGFEPMDGRGVAALDYDRDGDLDLAVSNRNGRFKLYENVGASANWLQLRVEGDNGETAIGARVTITVDDTTHNRWVNARSDFLSQDTRVVHVGLGEHRTVDEITITWPDGTTKTVTDVQANQRIVISKDVVSDASR